MWIIFIHIVINSKNSTFLNPNPALTIFHNPPSPMADYEYVFLMWLVSILSIHTIVSECCAHHSFWSTAPLSAKSMPIFAHLLGSDRTQKAESLCIPSSTVEIMNAIIFYLGSDNIIDIIPSDTLREHLFSWLSAFASMNWSKSGFSMIPTMLCWPLMYPWSCIYETYRIPCIQTLTLCSLGI